MKDRTPIKRTSRTKVEAHNDDFDYLCLTQEDWDEMERAARESDPPELPKELWFENWIPYRTPSVTFFEKENDEAVKIISWDNGILISHIPMLGTLEHLFFSRLMQLDLDDAVDFCITTSRLVKPDLRKKFLLKLIEETGLRVTNLLQKVNNSELAYEQSPYGPTNAFAFNKLRQLEEYLVNSVSSNGDLHPFSISIITRSSTEREGDDPGLSFKQILDRIKIKQHELTGLQKVQLLAWANMPFILWPLRLPRSFSKDIFFAFIGKLFNVEMPNQPNSNIAQALKQKTYHKDINALQGLLDDYHASFDKNQNQKLEKKKTRLLRAELERVDSNIKRKRT